MRNLLHRVHHDETAPDDSSVESPPPPDGATMELPAASQPRPVISEPDSNRLETLEDMAPDGSSVAPPPPPRLNQATASTYVPGRMQADEAVPPEPGESVRRIIPHASGAARIRIGRAAPADLVLGSPQVALKHAIIERGATTEPWLIANAGSVGRTFVNGVAIARQELADGDVVRIGPYRLEVRDGEIEYFDEATGLLLQALDLHEEVSRHKVILQNVSIIVQPHEFVAVVGASGSGKTTLLRALSGSHRAQGGQVLLNDYPLYDNFDALRTQIGLVPQDDIVHAELTVEQAFGYAARLRLAADMSKADRKARVEEVIQELGLDPQRKTIIANLSGGQRKRVSIGVELLTKPPLFFLDEPTSGLDPATGTHMMQLLRRLADQGRTVVVSTHVTRDIVQCDKVLFLTRGGRMA
ncbi:MAG: ATP-binding cassette domain-containing protein, partial [Dehalococcoidia bacterium]